MKNILLLILVLVPLSGSACSERTSLATPQVAPVVQRQKENLGFQSNQRVALKLPLKDPRIVVSKGERRLDLYSAGAVVRTYKIGLGLNPVDDKIRQGDRATPEGEFYIFTKNNRSAFYLSLGISYPNIEDAERGLRDGLITKAQHDAIVGAIRNKKVPPQNTRLGGEIYIHGNGASSDWTWGCVALENEDIKELFEVVRVGTPVTIKH